MSYGAANARRLLSVSGCDGDVRQRTTIYGAGRDVNARPWARYALPLFTGREHGPWTRVVRTDYRALGLSLLHRTQPPIRWAHRTNQHILRSLRAGVKGLIKAVVPC